MDHERARASLVNPAFHNAAANNTPLCVNYGRKDCPGGTTVYALYGKYYCIYCVLDAAAEHLRPPNVEQCEDIVAHGGTITGGLTELYGKHYCQECVVALAARYLDLQ